MMTVGGATLRRPRRGGFRSQCSSTRHLLAHLGTMIAVVQPLFEAVSAGGLIGLDREVMGQKKKGSHSFPLIPVIP